MQVDDTTYLYARMHSMGDLVTSTAPLETMSWSVMDGSLTRAVSGNNVNIEMRI
ncbi:predicted protein [Histoplasma capsulatum var. duboisii H88]|nr:predicted protein [Histoplasma capsulatum var. duboisii H88]